MRGQKRKKVTTIFVSAMDKEAFHKAVLEMTEKGISATEEEVKDIGTYYRVWYLAPYDLYTLGFFKCLFQQNTRCQ
jgi:hypothetical protein